MLSDGTAPLQLVHERQHRVGLAHACRVKPEQRTFRPGRARNAQALGQACGHLLAARGAPAQDRHGGRTRGRGHGPVKRKQETRAPGRLGGLRRGFPGVAAGQLIGALSGGVHGCFHLLPVSLHGLLVRIARHIDRIARHHRQLRERQVDREAAPGGQRDEAPGRDCKRHDGPAGHAPEHDDAHAGDAGRPRRDVGGHRHRDVLAQRLERRPERRGSAAILALFARARPPDQPHVEVQQHPADHLAVGVARDHVANLNGLGLDERQQQELAMPHGHDHGMDLFEIGVHVRRLADHLGG